MTSDANPPGDTIRRLKIMAPAGPLDASSLGGHRIVDKISETPRATVWKATDPRGRTVALKQAGDATIADAAALRRFKRCAGFLHEVTHPALLKAYEFFDVKPKPFYTLEFFAGEDLKTTFTHRAQRILKKEFAILRKVAEAMGHLHEKGLLHLDLRPENVLVSASGCDVRLAGLGGAETRLARLLPFGSRNKGHAAYASPEQTTGRRCDERSDYYSFGILMYELLTGHLPYKAGSDDRLREMHCKETPFPMRTYVPTISPEMDTFLWKLIAKSPDDRFDTLNDILAGLLRLEWADSRIRVLQVRRFEPPPPLMP